MSIRDLAQYFDNDLTYPGVPSRAHPDGKTYVVKSPDATTGLWLTQLAHVGTKAAAGLDLSDGDLSSLRLDDNAERNLYQRVLGDTYDELIGDGVSLETLKVIGQDAYLSFAMNEDTANAALASRGEAPARANRATRRAATKATPRTPSSTAGSSSKKAGGATPARTRATASTRSKSGTPARKAAAAKA